jgi:O-antigen ligase
MNNNISEESFHFVTEASQPVTFRVGFLMLICVALIRPLSLMGGEKVSVTGLEVLSIVGVAISYLLLLSTIASFRRFQFDRIGFFLLLFCLYATESLLWGSEIRKFAKTILPVLLFFSVRMLITDSKQLKTLLIIIVIAFIIPIILSTYNVVTGRSIEMIEIWNKLPRHAGAFTSSHTLAYVMLFFSFFFCILNHVNQKKNIFFRIVILFFLLLSFYCLYQSHTRTAYFGFIIFWFIYLWGTHRKLFYVALVLSIIVGIIFQSLIFQIIFKKDYIDLNTATSGRIGLLQKNIQLFLDSSLPQQLLGHGLGHERRFAFHSDYMRLLISLGIVGLFLYLILLFYLLWDIFLCRDKKTKYLFGAILISVAIMNFGSNAVVFRFELSQYFWLIMGLFYMIENSEIENNA